MERTITIQQIKDVAQEAYNLYKDNTDGKNADYIPYLANIDPKLFGISICLMNGEIIQLGDSQYRFGIESVSKVLTAILVLRQYGAPKVLEMIGADATGLPFNSIMAILLENDHPSVLQRASRQVRPARVSQARPRQHQGARPPQARRRARLRRQGISDKENCYE